MKKTFTWLNFSPEFIKAIVYANQTSRKPPFMTSDRNVLLPYMDHIDVKPTQTFVRNYRREIEEHFLKGSPYLIQIAKKLEKKGFKDMDLSTMESTYESVTRRKGTASLIDLYVKALTSYGRSLPADIDDFYFYTTPRTVDLTESVGAELPLFDYQADAVDSLRKFFIEDGNDAGIFVAPTGSGKTRIATKFLLADMISSGYQVIWLSHRTMLIEQAADSIYTASPILCSHAKEKETFKLICVSGKHARIQKSGYDDDVIIASVPTLNRNLDFLKAVVRDKVLIICDEAHHSVAPSYRNVIRKIQDLADECKLLGLTATPVRMSDSETFRLMKIYDHAIIGKIDAADLIARGFLATPIVENVDTNVDMKTIVTLEEEKYIRKWGELPSELLEKMATLNERNTLIVQKYMQGRQRYGKTLIFALNSHHCISLCEALQAEGVRCDYIYCAHKGNEEKIRKFKDGELDVLVNINVLTEGSDIPDIQTVFLTRPTSSDVLLMQMIGRGLRGKSCGGTETANIVDFHDAWGRAANWLNAEIIYDASAPEDADMKPAGKRKKPDLVPWAYFREVLAGIESSIVAGDEIRSNVSLPLGWYDVIDGDHDSKVMFFECQEEGFARLWDEHFDEMLIDNYYTAGEAIRDCFDPSELLPTYHGLDLVMNTARAIRQVPEAHYFAEREQIDPYLVARRVLDEDVPAKNIRPYVIDIFNQNPSLISSIFGGFDNYYDRVMNYVAYPNGMKPLGMKLDEIESELLPYDNSSCHDINQLFAEVLDEQFHGQYGELPLFSWTKGTPKGYWGKYTKPGNGGRDYMVINRIMNSSLFGPDTIKFVIYHELLHRDNMSHDKAFREKEHEFPDWQKHDQILANVFDKYNIKFDY